MTNPANREVRVLLPSKPEDGLGEAARLLEAMLPAARTHVRRLFVYRPVEADFYIPDRYSRMQEISQLEADAENATRVETERDMDSFAGAGFTVSSDVIRGTPTAEILREASFWKADLVAVRTRSLAADDGRVGGMTSALLQHGTCPVLTYRSVAPDYRLRRILIPTDFSAASRESADWALAMAALTGAEPILLHILARRANRHGINPDELLGLATGEVVRWKERLEPLYPGLVREARVLAADTPAEGILSFARERECDLIVLATTGVSAVRAALLGSNARKVSRVSECPVLVLPASNRVAADAFLRKARGIPEEEPKAEEVSNNGAKTRLSRILVATDLTPASSPAVRQAIAIARENDSFLLLAHAYQPPSLILEGYVPAATYESWDESLQSELKMRMQPFLDEAKGAGVSVEPLFLPGSPLEAITGAAKDSSADLLVVGTHARTGMPRFFLGSVAARIVSTAPCPVMTVRGEAERAV